MKNKKLKINQRRIFRKTKNLLRNIAKEEGFDPNKVTDGMVFKFIRDAEGKSNV